MRFVGQIIFSKFGFLPIPLIQCILLIHIIGVAIKSNQVYQSSYRDLIHTSGAEIHYAKEFQLQSKEFRSQRNLYLLCLSLLSWWMLYSVYSLKYQLVKLAESIQNNNTKSAAASAATGRSTIPAVPVSVSVPAPLPYNNTIEPSAPNISPEPPISTVSASATTIKRSESRKTK